MNFKRAIAGTTLAASLVMLVPAAPALADGAASTRNILLGVGAATYLIIQHNRKVHEKYAEDARRQAELQSQSNDAWAAYSSEKNAYNNAIAEVADLKKEVAYQHNVITQQRHQLATTHSNRSAFAQQAAYAPPSHAQSARHVASRNTPPDKDVAMVSYGWGQI